MTATLNPFQRATKRAVKARVAFDGPSGSGKTWTALGWATELAAGGTVAVIDTERRSASLYSGHHTFDALEMSPPFHPDRLMDAIAAAEAHGYAVLVIDSLTHFWSGEGGVLDVVDKAAAKGAGNSFTAWKEGSPLQRRMVDRILAADMHVIVTMRSKTEWVLEEDHRGKKVPRRVGLAAEQRSGLEYEFTMVGDLDLDHTLTFSKSRCDRLSDQVIAPHEAAGAAATFRAWLDDGEPLASCNDVDALLSRMNALPDDVRRTCKEAFKAEFGRPNDLVASKLEAAHTLVSRFEDTPPPGTEAPEPPTPTGDPGGQTGTNPAVASGDDAGGSDVPPADPPASGHDDLVDRTRVRDLAKLAGDVWPNDALGVARGQWGAARDRLRHALTQAVTGRTHHLDELTDDEATRLAAELHDLREGAKQWESTDEGLVLEFGDTRVLCPWVDAEPGEKVA